MGILPRELIGSEASEQLCPCCGHRLLPPGLFSANPDLPTPLPLQHMLDADELGTSLLEDEVLFSCGRFFARAELPLPLTRLDTPIRVKGWVEIDKDIFDELVDISEGQLNHLRAAATLACDIPGFPGSLGAKVMIERIYGVSATMIISCADGRIGSIPGDLGHDDMAALYRCIWGNEDEVAEADPELRKRVGYALQEFIDRPTYRKKMTPPAGLAGIEATDVIIAPPLDTGEEAILATVGCSDTAVATGSPVELIAWVRNPSDGFIRSFADFGYLSRLNDNPIRTGMIVPENPSIPDTDDRMAGWLLWSSDRLKKVVGIKDTEGRTVQLLEAIPLYEIEMVFAQAFGSDTLMRHLEESETDLSDLTRKIGIPIPEE